MDLLTRATNVIESRKTLLEAATAQLANPQLSNQALASITLKIFFLRGEQSVWYEVAQYLGSDLEDAISLKTLKARLMNLLFVGADDSWSGRSNDMNRAHHDGQREAIQNVFMELDA